MKKRKKRNVTKIYDSLYNVVLLGFCLIGIYRFAYIGIYVCICVYNSTQLKVCTLQSFATNAQCTYIWLQPFFTQTHAYACNFEWSRISCTIIYYKLVMLWFVFFFFFFFFTWIVGWHLATFEATNINCTTIDTVYFCRTIYADCQPIRISNHPIKL